MKFGEFFRSAPKEESNPETSAPHLKPEEEQHLAALENLVRMRMKNAILFLSFGDVRADQRELETVKESLADAMKKFGFTPEQTHDALQRLNTEAEEAAAKNALKNKHWH